MEMNGNHGFENSNICNSDIQGIVEYKIMQFSADQVMVLEKKFMECQNPSLAMMHSMISRCSALSNLNYLQIQAWFEHRRYLEHKKKETIVLNFLNERKAANERLMLLENEYLLGKVQHLSMENTYNRKLLNYASLESYLAPEMPRSIFKNSKVVAARRLIVLRNELLQNEAQQVQREDEYVRNLEEHINDTRARINALVSSLRNTSGTANNPQGLVLFAKTVKFPLKTPSALNWVLIPRMKINDPRARINALFNSLRNTFGTANNSQWLLLFAKTVKFPPKTLSALNWVSIPRMKDIKLDLIFFKDGEMFVPACLSLEIKKHRRISCKEIEDWLTAFFSAFMPQPSPTNFLAPRCVFKVVRLNSTRKLLLLVNGCLLIHKDVTYETLLFLKFIPIHSSLQLDTQMMYLEYKKKETFVLNFLNERKAANGSTCPWRVLIIASCLIMLHLNLI